MTLLADLSRWGITCASLEVRTAPRVTGPPRSQLPDRSEGLTKCRTQHRPNVNPLPVSVATYGAATSPKPHPVMRRSLDATGQECAPTRTPQTFAGSALHCACGRSGRTDGTCQSCTAPLNAVPRKRHCNGTVLPTNRTHLVTTHLGTQAGYPATDRAREETYEH